jgi:hypothetical protein
LPQNFSGSTNSRKFQKGASGSLWAHHRGNWLNISLQILSPAAPPVETFRYRPDRQSKGPRPSRLRRPGPLLDFAEPGRLPRVIDGRLRRGKRISRRNILPQRQTFLNFKYKLEVQSNENVR